MRKLKNLKIFLVHIFLLSSLLGWSDESVVQSVCFDFEGISIKPWVTVGNGATLSGSIVHSGVQALEINSGAIVQVNLKLKSSSEYKLTGWVKTESGSDEIRLGLKGTTGRNVEVASALADWKYVELLFETTAQQTTFQIYLQNPENTAKNKAWADDLRLEYLGASASANDGGIKPLTERVPIIDLGICQQPNEKMKWLEDAKFGMFIHWGLYAGPGKGEWYMENNGIEPEEYRKLAWPESGDQYFAADSFNAGEWASLAKEAGMKYMCMVTMHHDGYALFNTRANGAFSSMQTHNRDFVKEYVDACRDHGLRVGFYKTLINWHYPGYYDVSGIDCKPNKFGYTTNFAHKENARLMKNELFCQVKELMTNYGKIDLIFWDGGWLGQQGSDADGSYFWEPGKILDVKNAWPVDSCNQDFDPATGKPLGLMGIVRKYQPDVIVNSRSGWIGDIKSEEGGHAVNGPIRSGDAWEKCMTMAPGWGYTPAHSDPNRTIDLAKVKRMLADCVIRDMNLLLNVGPDRHGKISDVEANVLRETGKWLEQVGDAVYGTRGGPWNPTDNQFGYTCKGNTIYVYLLKDFKMNQFVLPALNPDQQVIKVYSVINKKPVSFTKLQNGETLLEDFEKTDDVVAILAVELNKEVISTKGIDKNESIE